MWAIGKIFTDAILSRARGYWLGCSDVFAATYDECVLAVFAASVGDLFPVGIYSSTLRQRDICPSSSRTTMTESSINPSTSYSLESCGSGVGGPMR
jgi:hypothetical protein